MIKMAMYHKRKHSGLDHRRIRSDRKTAVIERELKTMSDGKKTHVVTFLHGRERAIVNTNIGKNYSVKHLEETLKKLGYKVKVI